MYCVTEYVIYNVVLLATAFRQAVRPSRLPTQWSQGSKEGWKWFLPFTYLHKNARKYTSYP